MTKPPPQTFPAPAMGEEINIRQVWATNRLWMETENMKSRRYGGKGHHHWYLLLAAIKGLKKVLEATRLYDRWKKNAEDIALNERELFFSNLPLPFDGFRILHLSDLHIDGMPLLKDRLIEMVQGKEFDLCVLTGDFRQEIHGHFRETMRLLKSVLNHVRSRHGFFGVLGNHDSWLMVKPLETLGIRMLINESEEIVREGEKFRIVGTDDVHYYFTDQAIEVLDEGREDFSLALVHSPELYEAAADAEIDLYLCGHTHGGQICLPGGIPIITHANVENRFCRGYWRYKNLQGFTNCGVGTSGLPVRYATRGEALIFTLHRR